MVRGGQADVTQYWGKPRLPKRRRRIFLVADFRGDRAREILFKERAMLPNPPSGTDSRVSATETSRIYFEKSKEEHAHCPTLSGKAYAK